MNTEKLAIDGGAKAVPKLGPFPAKIGKDELLEILSMWQFSPATQQKLGKMIEDEPDVQGPHLFRYYNPRPSKVAAAEEAMRQLVGVKHCLAVNSCTSALVASYRAMGIGVGDEVIVPAYTFFATSATVASSNAIPVIVDVDDSLTMDPDQIKKAIEAMQAEGVPVGGIYDSKIRDWHVYNYWEHILDKKSVARDGLPWSAVPAAELPRYSRGMCPRTLDLLSRAVMLDVNWNYSARDCSAIALGINKVLRTILK